MVANIIKFFKNT